MKIVVIGGSGLIGTKLVKILQSSGHNVVIASPTFGVNTITMQGLSQALKNAEVVIDVSNSPLLDDISVANFFNTSSKNLIEKEKTAGVKHHIILSIVGTINHQDSGYMRAKHEQEELIKASGIPFTILYSTQFFEFVGKLADLGSIGNKIQLPATVVQPISANEVAEVLSEIAISEPLNAGLEIAGPQQVTLVDFVKKYLQAKRDTRKIVVNILNSYFGAKVSTTSLLPSKDAKVGQIEFQHWLDNERTLKQQKTSNYKP